MTLRLNNLIGFGGGGRYEQNLVRSNTGSSGTTTVKAGAATSDDILISLWINIPTPDGTLPWFVLAIGSGATDSRVRMQYISATDPGQIQIQMGTSSPTNIVSASTTETHTQGVLHHVLYARSGTTHAMYVDDAAQTLSATPNSSTIDYTGIDATDVSGSPFTGDEDVIVGDVWIGPEQFLDITVEANRRKFSDASGNPIPLGNVGQLVTGTSPYIFMGDTMKAAEWNSGTNLGAMTGFSLSGGPFTDE